MGAGELRGRVHALQSFGAADGPGVRYVVFLQGCPLRCSCCHNPDTWDSSGGTLMSAREVFDEIQKYRPYFGKAGGVTLSGGEPLLQAEFCGALFSLCRQAGIHTCLDTSGCILDGGIKSLLGLSDLVLLDVKYTQEEDYRAYVGCSLKPVLEFLDYLNRKKIPVWLRQVIIGGKNDDSQNIARLFALKENHPNVEKVELLPFKTLCAEKYRSLGIPFSFGHIPPTPPSVIEQLLSQIK